MPISVQDSVASWLSGPMQDTPCGPICERVCRGWSSHKFGLASTRHQASRSGMCVELFDFGSEHYVFLRHIDLSGDISSRNKSCYALYASSHSVKKLQAQTVSKPNVRSGVCSGSLHEYMGRKTRIMRLLVTRVSVRQPTCPKWMGWYQG